MSKFIFLALFVLNAGTASFHLSVGNYGMALFASLIALLMLVALSGSLASERDA